MSGERVKLYTAKMGEGEGETGGGARERENASPPSPSSLPSFFSLREFFSLALLSERLEQATKVTKKGAIRKIMVL